MKDDQILSKILQELQQSKKQARTRMFLMLFVIGISLAALVTGDFLFAGGTALALIVVSVVGFVWYW